MNAPILTGSASWTDPTLIACGRFYPPGCTTAQARLRHYASVLPLVEVDSSYYGMPTPHNSRLWAERTPPGFVFNVKAFSVFTGHATRPEAMGRDIAAALAPLGQEAYDYAGLPDEIRTELWRRFALALAPLKQAGKLGAVHFQFSPRVRHTAAAEAHVAHCVDSLPGHLLSVEFRHASWFAAEALERTLAFEREAGVAHTVVDAPQGVANSVPCVWEATHPKLALVRLHGRNRAAWGNVRGTASSSRFDYRYSEAELAAMVPEIEQLATQAEAVHVVFNTNHQDQGQVHARMMRELLRMKRR
ncbi:MAG: DUF72 domain-containing protein [Pseudomonadota bacterium]